MLVVLAVVVLCYCGGKYCPAVLKQNKELVLGVLVGMALCSFAGLKLEGFDSEDILSCMRDAGNAPTGSSREKKVKECMNMMTRSQKP